MNINSGCNTEGSSPAALVSMVLSSDTIPWAHSKAAVHSHKGILQRRSNSEDAHSQAHLEQWLTWNPFACSFPLQCCVTIPKGSKKESPQPTTSNKEQRSRCLYLDKTHRRHWSSTTAYSSCIHISTSRVCKCTAYIATFSSLQSPKLDDELRE